MPSDFPAYRFPFAAGMKWFLGGYRATHGSWEPIWIPAFTSADALLVLRENFSICYLSEVRADASK